MRLIETSPSAPIPRMRDFIGSQIPPYAILSHTWEDDEVSLQQLLAGAADPSSALEPKAGFRKIQQTCALARTRDRIEYAWVDTCCIDKTSSAELAEAINSMYAWYRDAEVCYVFLSDLEPGTADDLQADLPKCRWFTRGWTLQELIAPREVLFFDKEWGYRGNKKELAGLLCAISGVPQSLLRQAAELCDFAVARRMSWAARRETTRVEDMAYCLLGIFDVHMSLIYGEGIKAFARLQTAILQTTPDMSIFAWTDDRVPCPPFAGALAEFPRQFASCSDIVARMGDSAYADFAITTRGIQTDASLIHSGEYRNGTQPLLLDMLCSSEGNNLAVCVRKIGGGLYARCNPDIRVTPGKALANFRTLRRLLVETLTLAVRLPPRFPFHPGTNPVLGNRWSALRVNWGPLAARSYLSLPVSHWDPQDDTFFSCNSGSKGWCSLFGYVYWPRTSRLRLKLFIACFRWNQGPLTVLLANMSDMDPSTRLLLEAQLEQIRFESCRRAEFLVRGVFKGSLEERVVQTDFGSVELLSPSRWVAGRGQEPVKPEAIPVLTLRRELLPGICVNPVTSLNFSLGVL